MSDTFEPFVSVVDWTVRWTSVKDIKPGVGDPILMLIPTGINFVCSGSVSERQLEDDEGEFSELFLADQYGDDIGYSLECLTHWMPMPEPPSDD